MYKDRRITLICVAVALLLTVTPFCLAGQNPEALLPETAQFAFLIGDWKCATRFLKPGGSGQVEATRKIE